MARVLSTVLLVVLGFALDARAASVPEIDPGSASSAIALIGGAALLIRSWRSQGRS